MSGLQASAVAALVACIYLWAAVSRALGLVGREPRCGALLGSHAHASARSEMARGRANDPGAPPSSRRGRSSGGFRAFRVEQDRASGEWTLVPES